MDQPQKLFLKITSDSESVLNLLSKFNKETEYQSRLRHIRELAELRFDNSPALKRLQELILSEMNNELRYQLTKILYMNYPDKALTFLTQILISDYNYNFRIINFTEDKRYNMNDILNFIIIKKYHRKQMVNDIINNNLLQFAVSWKDYITEYFIFYDLSLRCFLLCNKESKMLFYLCSRINDPFDFLSVQKNIIISHTALLNELEQKILREIIQLFIKIVKVRASALNLAIMKIEHNEHLPKFKVLSENHDFIIYFNT